MTSEQREIQAFLEKAFDHYEQMYQKLEKEFDVLAVSDQHYKDYAPELAGIQMWADLSEQLDLHVIVEYAPNNNQVIWTAVSKNEITEPDDFYELWRLTSILMTEDESWTDDDKIDALDQYQGPNKLDVPEELLYLEEISSMGS